MEEKNSFNWKSPYVPLIGALFILGEIVFLIIKFTFTGMEFLDWLNFVIGFIVGIAFLARFYKEKRKDSIVEANSYLTKVGIFFGSLIILGLLLGTIFILFFSIDYSNKDCETKSTMADKYDCYSQVALQSRNVEYCNKIDDNSLHQKCIEATLITAFESCCSNTTGNFDEETSKSNACCKQKFLGSQYLYSCFAYCAEKSALGQVTNAYKNETPAPINNNLNQATTNSDLLFISVNKPDSEDVVYIDENLFVQLKVIDGEMDVKLILVNISNENVYSIPGIYHVISNKTRQTTPNPDDWDDFNISLSFSDWNKMGLQIPIPGKYLVQVSNLQGNKSWGGSIDKAFTIIKK